MTRRPALATTLVLAWVLLAGCTGSPQPTPTTAGLPSPTGYATRALDLIGTNLFIGDGWPAVRGVALQRVEVATRTPDTYAALRDALAAAGQSPGDLVSTETMAAVPPSTAEPSTTSSPEADGITTLTLPGFVDLTARPGSGPATPAEKAFARRGSAVIANAAALTTCGWIVDVRRNSGTDVPVLVGTVAPLLPAGATLVEVDRAGAVTRLSLTDDAVTINGRTVLPLDPVRRIAQPVVVLQDTGTIRAGEAVVLSFRGREGATTIGGPTIGKAVDGTTELLADGAHLVVLRWRIGDRNGATATGPIAPDRLVAGPAAQLSAARDWLRERCQ